MVDVLHRTHPSHTLPDYSYKKFSEIKCLDQNNKFIAIALALCNCAADYGFSFAAFYEQQEENLEYLTILIE